MALVIEDGSQVSGANSYVTVAEARTFATARGVTLSAVDADVEVLAFQAMDYLEALRSSFKGYKVSDIQALQWPREDVYIDDYYFDSDDIPQELKNAQCQLMMDAVDTTLQGNSGGRTVTKEKVDVIEVEYSAMGATTDQPIFSKANAFLAPLLIRSGNLGTVRI